MEKRKLGKSNLWVSKMGLGCMSLGTDEVKAAGIIEAAIEEGVNYFDTADLYDYGVNEEMVGKILAPFRDEVIIATKVGNRWNEQKTAGAGIHLKVYKRGCQKQPAASENRLYRPVPIAWRNNRRPH